jgi:Na+/melibiose symporter-like transporter
MSFTCRSLLAQAGIEKKWVIWVLMADQLIFTLMDFSLGVAADKVVGRLRRLGPWLLGATAVSCLAFLLLPHCWRRAVRPCPAGWPWSRSGR